MQIAGMINLTALCMLRLIGKPREILEVFSIIITESNQLPLEISSVPEKQPYRMMYR
jgi:hypothetical protein